MDTAGACASAAACSALSHKVPHAPREACAPLHARARRVRLRGAACGNLTLTLVRLPRFLQVPLFLSRLPWRVLPPLSASAVCSKAH